MKKNNAVLLSTPYLIWMVLFTLIPLGIVYIIEALSDIIQVGYFKLSHGKRVFKMAPIHHHFEKCGWSEIKVFTVFSAVSLLFAILTFIGMVSRYRV